jgi:hypothetical protein
MRKLSALSIVMFAALAAASGCNLLKPAPAKKFGDACASNIDCESMSCNTARGGICTKSCNTDADCTGGLVCAADPTGTGASCGKKQGTATGGACKDRGECDHGPCLHKEDDEEHGFCSMRCASGNDCPANFKVCAAISDMGSQKLCLPGADQNAAPPKIGTKKTGAPPPVKPATTKK